MPFRGHLFLRGGTTNSAYGVANSHGMLLRFLSMPLQRKAPLRSWRRLRHDVRDAPSLRDGSPALLHGIRERDAGKIRFPAPCEECAPGEGTPHPGERVPSPEKALSAEMLVLVLLVAGAQTQPQRRVMNTEDAA